MELLRKLAFCFTCATLIIVAKSQNGRAQHLYPVYLGPKAQMNNADVSPRMVEDIVLTNHSDSSLQPQNLLSNVSQSGINITDPNKVTIVNVNRGPSKYHSANLPINQQHQVNPLRQLTDNEATPLNNLIQEGQTNGQRHIITAPVSNPAFVPGNSFNLLQGQDFQIKPVATNLTELTFNANLNSSLLELNSFQPSQYLPSNILVNRQLPSAIKNQQPPQLINKQSSVSSLLTPEDRSSYSWYTPQTSKVKEPEIDRNSVNPSYYNTRSQPVAQPYFQQPNGNYDLQYLPDYNPESELSEKQDQEDNLDDYLNNTAGFINGSIVAIFALALSLLLLAIITATTVGRKKREVEIPEGSSTWEVTDMIQCVARFYCEMEQWDQKYPPQPSTPSNESRRKDKFTKDRQPREATNNRRKNCGRDYRKCPVNFTIMRTLWRMYKES